MLHQPFADLSGQRPQDDVKGQLDLGDVLSSRPRVSAQHVVQRDVVNAHRLGGAAQLPPLVLDVIPKTCDHDAH